jgi:hypothetical protein
MIAASQLRVTVKRPQVDHEQLDGLDLAQVCAIER